MRRRIDSVTGTLLSRRLCGDQPPQALYRLLKNSHFCHSERSEESLLDFKSNAQRDSSAKNPPRNDKNILFPQPLKAAGKVLRCHSEARFSPKNLSVP